MNKLERSYKPIPIRQRIKLQARDESPREYNYVEFLAIHLGSWESPYVEYTLYETKDKKLVIHTRERNSDGQTKASYLEETTSQELITDPALKMLAKEAGIIEPLTLKEALSNEQ